MPTVKAPAATPDLRLGGALILSYVSVMSAILVTLLGGW